MSVEHFTAHTFQDQVLNSDKPVLVDFWAEWCMPCKFIAPTVQELAKEYGDQMKFGKLNVDENPSIASQYGISGIPSLLVYKGGKVVDTVVGAVPKPHLEAVIKKHIEFQN